MQTALLAHEARKDRIRQTVFLARQRLAKHSTESLLLASAMDQVLRDMDNVDAYTRLKNRIPEDLHRFL